MAATKEHRRSFVANPTRFIRTMMFVLLAGAGLLAVIASASGTPALALPLQANSPQQVAGFLGAWCAQGDPAKHASISSNGPGNSGAFLNLTNENGDTSIGNLQGPNRIVAPQWQFVTGTLTNDGSQINWSNGTFWARCNNGGGGGHHRPNLTGTWFASGQRSRSCSIRQRHGNLSLQNESGQSATGSFTDRHNIVTNWQGTTIRGRISQHGNRIDWDNGTYWTRDRLYTQ